MEAGQARGTADEVSVKPIGIIRSPFKSKAQVPIQPCFSEALGEVEVFEEYAEGLKDVEGFSHIILIYFFHEVHGFTLHVKPFLDTEEHGLFATRYPRRPNPLGLSVVELLQRDGRQLRIRRVDMLDGTPLLDIKPYVPRFDAATDVQIGWLDGKLQ